ncbi:MAG: alkaline phosphatase family protein, partial [Candidatus Eisenbacteria bacterium]
MSSRTPNETRSNPGGTFAAAVGRGLILGAAVGITLSAAFLIWFLMRNPLLVDSLGLSLLLFVVLPTVTFGMLGLLVGVLAGVLTRGRTRGRAGAFARRWLVAGLVVVVAVCAVGRGVAAMSARNGAGPGLKLLLIGVDGATWRVARPMLERGAMPNIAAAAESGSSGVLMSMSPMFSPRIFTTIASGKVADKHGVQGPSDTTTDAVLVKRVWDILWEQKGWDYGLVEWYVTGPPRASPGGFCIPGPPAVTPETVPPELSFLKSIERSAGGSRGGARELVGLAFTAASRGATVSRLVELAGVGLMKVRGAPKLDVYRRQHAAIVGLTTDVTLWQLRRGDVEVLAGIYRSTDRLSHSFWRYHEPEAFADTDAAALDEFGNTIEDIYSLVDEQIGRLMPCLAPDGVLMVFSDHGFQPYLTVRAEPFSFRTETL